MEFTPQSVNWRVVNTITLLDNKIAKSSFTYVWFRNQTLSQRGCRYRVTLSPCKQALKQILFTASRQRVGTFRVYLSIDE